MRRLIILVALLPALLAGQQLPTFPQHNVYDEDRLPPSFFKANRSNLLQSMGDSAVAVLYGAGEHTRNNDVDFPYRQDDNFYYLTGCQEANAALLLSSAGMKITDSSGTRIVHEILFVEKRDSSVESWTGRRLGSAGAIKVLGVEHALPMDDFERTLRRAAFAAKTVFVPVAPEESKGELASLLRTIASTSRMLQQSKDLRSPVKMIRAMREIKQPEELVAMKRAAEISMEGHRAIMRTCRPGLYEYQLQAAFEEAMTAGGAEHTAYSCIVGSGENSVILHYESNRRKLRDGDVVVMDCGAEYHNYAADITRTIPVNGKFTKAQREIYEIVLKAQDECIHLIKPGVNYFAVVNAKAVEVIRDGLLRLGIIKDSADYRKYFTHSVGHTVGLDVHDISQNGFLRPGQVWTVEPGIYIPENAPGVDAKYRNIGIRIEDEVLVTADGCLHLTADLPREPGEVERMMRH
jgi:Xaa-Pro aminopeptidase